MAGGDWAEGGCHCGAVRFRVRIDAREVVACNCSLCRIRADLQLIVPPDAFEILAGEEALASYRFNTGTAVHRFCRTCGIHPFNHPRSHPEHVAVNARCLDSDGTADHGLARFRVRPFDGREWEHNVAALRSAEQERR